MRPLVQAVKRRYRAGDDQISPPNPLCTVAETSHRHTTLNGAEMRSTVCSVAFSVCAFVSMPARGLGPALASTEDEAAIRRIVAEQVEAWNGGDAHAYARHFAIDGMFTNIYGMVFDGRDAFEKRHAETFATFFDGTARSETIRVLRMITRDVVIVELDAEVRGVGNMPSCLRPAQSGVLRTRLELVFVRRNGSWWIVSYHNVAVAAGASLTTGQ